MRTRKLEIRIMSDAEHAKATSRFLRDVVAGKRRKPQRYLLFNSVELMRKFLTPQRQLMIRAIRRKQPKSVYELAKMLGRDRKVVADDLKILEEMGLVSFHTHVHDGRARSQPVAEYDRISMEMEL